ncbi:hypothetical protein B9Z55_014456 [Caenorhabditis nigoni]|uniref:Uncharacterized protein n=1 Tax=Caenorhabditis nigoni TaxID=1611254 RepID=A0A2G5U6H1_9PELO|nr:hypothetical protein B9Z55_014456 [Caenorhabditis nigoni]
MPIILVNSVGTRAALPRSWSKHCACKYTRTLCNHPWREATFLDENSPTKTTRIGVISEHLERDATGHASTQKTKEIIGRITVKKANY